MPLNLYCNIVRVIKRRRVRWYGVQHEWETKNAYKILIGNYLGDLAQSVKIIQMTLKETSGDCGLDLSGSG
jgi:hypothetical protein